MRKSIPLESPPARSQTSRKSLSPCIRTLLVVLAAISALFAVQLSAQTPAASPFTPPASANSKTPVHAASKPAGSTAHKQVQRHKRPTKAELLAAKAAVTPPLVVTPPPPEPPHWPANERPADASVTWDSHGLLISAQNSSLRQILSDVSAATGAKVEGLGADQRIFGSYGPGKAREVLSQLLDGTGYNVLMIGDQGEGPPRQIVLTSRNGSNAQAAANAAPPTPNTAEEEADPNDEPPAEDNGARRLGRHGGDHNNPDPNAPPH
jgi:hypothetical protein